MRYNKLFNDLIEAKTLEEISRMAMDFMATTGVKPDYVVLPLGNSLLNVFQGSAKLASIRLPTGKVLVAFSNVPKPILGFSGGKARNLTDFWATDKDKVYEIEEIDREIKKDSPFISKELD